LLTITFSPNAKKQVRHNTSSKSALVASRKYKWLFSYQLECGMNYIGNRSMQQQLTSALPPKKTAKKSWENTMSHCSSLSEKKERMDGACLTETNNIFFRPRIHIVFGHYPRFSLRKAVMDRSDLFLFIGVQLNDAQGYL
jgi:hypothetical protein